MKIARGAGEDEFIADEAAQHGGDGGRVLVPLARVADEHEIAFQLFAVGFEKGRKRGRAAFLFALDQHRDVDRQSARDGLPGAERLEEGHELAFVVFRTPRDDHLAVAGIVREARLEGRRRPKLERVGGLHVIMAVEEDVGQLGIGGLAVVRDDHRMAGRRNDFGLREADVRKGRGAPVGGLAAMVLIGRIGRDAFDPQEIEQPREAGVFRLRQSIENPC